MNHEIYQIYDRIFKRIFALSNLAIINMINGLFGTNHSPDSKVTYPNKEFVNRMLKNRLADVFVTINDMHTYHMEAQIQKDDNIVLRVFEYGFQFAVENCEEESVLKFPEPVVIYLSKENEVPKESTLLLDFGEQGCYKYKVKNYVYLDHDVIEINQKKMVVLIPFQLLRLKNLIHQHPEKENFEELQRLLQDDIIASVQANLAVGNIMLEDANQLLELTHQLHEHLYAHYYEIGGCKDMKPLLEGAMVLPMDKYRIRIDELEEEKAKMEEQLAREKAEAEEKLAKERAKAKEMSLENERLKKLLQELQKQ